MTFYAKLIAEIIKTDDEATCVLIEELMRSDRTALDHLTPAEFRGAVVQALRDAKDMADAGMLTMWCEAYGLAVPVVVA